MMANTDVSWDDDDEEDRLNSFLVIADQPSSDDGSLLHSPVIASNARIDVRGVDLDTHEPPSLGFNSESLDGSPGYLDSVFTDPSTSSVLDDELARPPRTPTLSIADVASSLLREAIAEEQPRFYQRMQRESSGEVTVLNQFIDDSVDELDDDVLDAKSRERHDATHSSKRVKREGKSASSARASGERRSRALTEANDAIPSTSGAFVSNDESCRDRDCPMSPLASHRCTREIATPEITAHAAEIAISAFCETVSAVTERGMSTGDGEVVAGEKLQRGRRTMTGINREEDAKSTTVDFTPVGLDESCSTRGESGSEEKEPRVSKTTESFSLTPELRARFEIVDCVVLVDAMAAADVDRYYRPAVSQTRPRPPLPSKKDVRDARDRRSGAIAELANCLAASANQHKIVVRKKRKLATPTDRRRHSSSGSYGTPPSGDHPVGKDGTRTRDVEDAGRHGGGGGKRVQPKTLDANRECFVCRRWLADCVDDWTSHLGVRSVYCSRACVLRQVEMAREVFDDVEEHVIVMDRSGKVIGAPIAPRLRMLKEFLLENADYCPVLPQQRSTVGKKATASGDRDPSASGSMPDQDQSSGNRTNKVLSRDTDVIRNNVRRLIQDTLSIRVKKATDVVCSATEMKACASRIEQELFRQCQQDTQGRYRNWFRMFLSQLKDVENEGLFRRVITGSISTPRLVSLQPNELGDEMWSAMPVRDAKTAAVKKTSIEVEDEAGEEPKRSVLVRRQNLVQPELNCGGEEVATPTPTPSKPPTSTLDALLGPDVQDTTALHKSHLFDAKCDICRQKKEEQIERDLKRRRILQRRKQIDQQMDNKRKLEEQRRELEAKQQEYTNASFGNPASRDALHGTAPALAMSQLESGERGEWGEGEKEDGEGEARTPAIGEASPWTSADLRVWSGRLTMPRHYSFPCSLSAVSNARAFALRDELGSRLVIKGRICPIVVWEYLKNMKLLNMKDVIVLKIDPPEDVDERRAYDGLLDNMRRKARYCVVENPNLNIKDFYLLPLVANDSPPDMLLPFDGIGLSPSRSANLILCVVVRHRCESTAIAKSSMMSTGDCKTQQMVALPTPRKIPRECASAATPGDRKGTPLLAHVNPCISPTMITVAQAAANAAAAAAVTRRPIRQFGSPASDDSQDRWAGPELHPMPDGVEDNDSLLPSSFFETMRRATGGGNAGGERSRQEERIESVGDLLIAIAIGTDPVAIYEMVKTYLDAHDLKTEEIDVIVKAVTAKINVEKAKGGEQKMAVNTGGEQAIARPKRGKLTPIPADVVLSSEGDENDRDRPFSPSDFDNAERPLSFVGSPSKLAKRAPLVLKWTSTAKDRRMTTSSASNTKNADIIQRKWLLNKEKKMRDCNDVVNDTLNGYLEELSEWRRKQQQDDNAVASAISNTTASTSSTYTPPTPVPAPRGVPPPASVSGVRAPSQASTGMSQRRAFAATKMDGLQQSVAMDVDAPSDEEAPSAKAATINESFSSLLLPPPPPPPDLLRSAPPRGVPAPPFPYAMPPMMGMMMRPEGIARQIAPPIANVTPMIGGKPSDFSMPGDPELAAFGFAPPPTPAVPVRAFVTGDGHGYQPVQTRPMMPPHHYRLPPPRPAFVHRPSGVPPPLPHHAQMQSAFMHAAMTSQSQSEQLQATRMPAMSVAYPTVPVTVQRPPPPVVVQRPSASVTVQRPPAPVAVPRPPVPSLPSGYATAIRRPYSQSDANVVRPQFGGGGVTTRPIAPPQLPQNNLQSRNARDYGGVRGPKTPPPKDAGNTPPSTGHYFPAVPATMPRGPQLMFDEDEGSDGDGFFIGGSNPATAAAATGSAGGGVATGTRPDSASAQSESSVVSASTRSEVEEQHQSGPGANQGASANRGIFGRMPNNEELGAVAAASATELEEGEITTAKEAGNDSSLKAANSQSSQSMNATFSSQPPEWRTANRGGTDATGHPILPTPTFQRLAHKVPLINAPTAQGYGNRRPLVAPPPMQTTPAHLRPGGGYANYSNDYDHQGGPMRNGPVASQDRFGGRLGPPGGGPLIGDRPDEYNRGGAGTFASYDDHRDPLSSTGYRRSYNGRHTPPAPSYFRDYDGHSGGYGSRGPQPAAPALRGRQPPSFGGDGEREPPGVKYYAVVPPRPGLW